MERMNTVPDNYRLSEMVVNIDTSNPPWQQYNFGISARILKGKPEARAPGFCFQKVSNDDVAVSLQFLGSELLDACK